MLDKLRAPLFRALGVKTAVLDGVRVSTDPANRLLDPIRSQLFKRSYEAPERDILLRTLQPDDRVLDIGACIGLTAVLSAKIVGSANVLAYEANPDLETLIRTNFRLNGLDPSLRMRAVTSDGRDINFHVSENIFSSSLIHRGYTKLVRVQSDAFPVILAEFKPTVVSIDVEGAEAELIFSSELPGVRSLLIETHPHIIGPLPTASVLERIENIGFTRSVQLSTSFAFSR